MFDVLTPKGWMTDGTRIPQTEAVTVRPAQVEP